jgi:hypothetical protein
MKHKIKLKLVMLLIVLIILACNRETLPATVTPVPTNTSIPTDTVTPKPTSTPLPTATLEPTPAPVGVPVRSDLYEVTVLKTRRIDSGVHPGDGYYWMANPGNVFIELEVRVRNLLLGITESVPWKKIYVVESSEDAWYPNWGGYKDVVNGIDFDPSTLNISRIRDGEVLLPFTVNLYLRLIYVVADSDPTVVLFGFDNSPMIQVVIKK